MPESVLHFPGILRRINDAPVLNNKTEVPQFGNVFTQNESTAIMLTNTLSHASLWCV